MIPDDSDGTILKGVGSGAATGATAGAAGGPVGSAFGAIAGAVVGAVAGKQQQERQIKAQREANAATALREDTALGRQYRQSLMTGLNPTNSFGLNAPETAQMAAPDIANNGAQIGATVSSAFGSLGSQLTGLENARENREMQDRLNRLSAAGQLLGFHYQQTFSDYQLNQNFINDRQMKLKEVETEMISNSSLTSQELQTLKTSVSEDSSAVKDSAMKVDGILSKVGLSLENAEKDTEQSSYGMYANGSVSASLNPFKFLSANAQIGGKYDHAKTIEQAKKAVSASDLTKEEKSQAVTELNTLQKHVQQLEKSVRSLSQSSESFQKSVQRLGFNSYIEMLLEIEELQSTNVELKEKLSPSYMFKKYEDYYNLNY